MSQLRSTLDPVQQKNQDLIAAAERGNVRKMHHLIAAKADLNYQNETSQTALIEAAKIIDTKGMKVLLDAKANPNFQTPYGGALLVAVKRKNFAATKLLLKANACPNKHSIGSCPPLIAAIETEGLAILKALLAAKADSNYSTNNNVTPLMGAALHGNQPIVQELLQAKARVEDVNSNGDSVLAFAASSEQEKIDVVRMLIKATPPAHINPKNREGVTPLMLAAKKGHLAFVQELVAAKADIYERSFQDQTAFDFATNHHQVAVIQYFVSLIFSRKQQDAKSNPAPVAQMLEIMSDVTIPFSKQSSRQTLLNELFLSAVTNNHLEDTTKLIAARANLDYQGISNVNALTIACCDKSSLPLVTVLLAAKANPSIQHEQGGALLTACVHENFTAVKTLLEAKANVNEKNQIGLTPLIASTGHGDLATVTELLSAKADINHQYKHGNSALKIAVVTANLPVFTTLLAAKAQTNLIDSDGRSILDIAIMHALSNHPGSQTIPAASSAETSILSELIKHSPVQNLNRKNQEGLSPLMRFAAVGNLAIVQELVKAGVDLTGALAQAEKNKHSAVVKFLQESNTPVEAKQAAATATKKKSVAKKKSWGSGSKTKPAATSELSAVSSTPADAAKSSNHGNSQFMAAIFSQQLALANQLLTAGADIQQKNHKQQTPLMLAAIIGQKELVAKLLSLKSAIDEQDQEGNTALMLCAKKGHVSIVEKLLAAGSSIDLINHKHQTAFMLANENGHQRIVSLLREKAKAKLAEAKKQVTFAPPIQSSRPETTKPAQQSPVLATRVKETKEKAASEIIAQPSNPPQKTPENHRRDGRQQSQPGSSEKPEAQPPKPPVSSIGTLPPSRPALLAKAAATVTAKPKAATTSSKTPTPSPAPTTRPQPPLLTTPPLAPLATAANLSLPAPPRQSDNKQVATTEISSISKVRFPQNPKEEALVTAVKETRMEYVTAELDKGAFINLKDEEPGDSLLMLAVSTNLFTAVLSLLFFKPNIDHQNQRGETALIYAAKNGRDAIVNALLKTKANPALQDETGNTALLWAVNNGYLEVVKKLLETSPTIHVNLMNRTSNSPLLSAVTKGHKEMVNLLLKAKANIQAENSEGNAISLAQKHGHAEVAHLLSSHYSPAATDSLPAAKPTLAPAHPQLHRSAHRERQSASNHYAWFNPQASQPQPARQRQPSADMFPSPARPQTS